jgi:hypothetical protein
VIFGPGDIHDEMTPLEVAHAFLGVVETTGPNRGPWIDRWLRYCGLEPDPAKNPKVPRGGYPWCAAFVSWCCWRGGRPLPSPSAGVLKLWQAHASLAVKEPKMGDLLLRLEPGQTHIGMFIRDLGGRWESIEGNTNAGGSREGNAVEVKERPRSHWQGILSYAVREVA